jgi:hypothetical protein
VRAADFLTSAVLIGIGLLVIADALRLGTGWGTDGPQSGFFPFWLAVIMITASLVIVVQTVRRLPPRPFVTRQALVPVLKMLGPALGAVVLIQVVGLYVASALYLAFYMRWIGRHSWLAMVALGVGFPVVTFLIFERWFLVPMPKGPLETWLGY